jgi:hypothetical protein
MLNTLRGVFRAGFKPLVSDIGRLPKLGDDPFTDMVRLLCGQEHPAILDVGDHNFALVPFYEKYFQNGVIGWTDALFINRQFLERDRIR